MTNHNDNNKGGNQGGNTGGNKDTNKDSNKDSNNSDKKGLASVSEQEHTGVASQGGKATHEGGDAHEAPQTAKEAGGKGEQPNQGGNGGNNK